MAFGDVLRSADTPRLDGYPGAIGGDANTIWYSDYSLPEKVYELSTTDFSVVRSASSPQGQGLGMGGDADTIWYSESNPYKRDYELSTTDFSVVRSADQQTAYASVGLGGKADVIWQSNYWRDKIYELSTTDFSDVRGGNSPYIGSAGIGGNADTIWHSDVDADVVYELSNTDFSVVRSANSPGDLPEGIGGTSNIIWHCDQALDKIYELSSVGVLTVTTDPATNIEEETATLNGEITATGGENADQRGFDWGLDVSYGNSWTESDSYGVAAFSHGVSGLSPGTTIHFRAKAHNSAGWGYGDDLTFVTKPEACTNMVATAISDSQIDVSWTKGAGAVNTVVRRKVGAYPATIADGEEAYNGPSASFSDQGLIPSTAYYYRGWCYTDPHYADAYCQDNATTMALPPAILPPTVTTESANNTEQTLATINGELTNDGGEACDCWFEYGKVGDTIYTTAVQGGKTTGALFLADLTDLTHNTRYHFRAIAKNSTGITYGANMYFVTESPALLEYSLLQPELVELLR